MNVHSGYHAHVRFCRFKEIVPSRQRESERHKNRFVIWAEKNLSQKHENGCYDMLLTTAEFKTTQTNDADLLFRACLERIETNHMSYVMP